MSFHRNAKLGLAGRYAPLCAVARGMTLKATAARRRGHALGVRGHTLKRLRLRRCALGSLRTVAC
jgi:hypothetical protein